MMVQCQDIMNFVEEIAPLALAEEWDNVGLLVGNRDKKVDRVMLCLDITSAALEEAVKNKVNLIITHHPVIFKGLKRLLVGESKGSILHMLIKNDINVYSAHTNLDFAVTGVNTHLAESLRIKNAVTFGEGPGKMGMLDKKMSFHDFIEHVKISLNAPFVRVAGNVENDIQKVAVFCGGFDDDLEAIKQCNPDILVTGDLKHHTAIDAAEEGLCIMDAGHFNTEKVILGPLSKALKENFPGIEVFCFQKEEEPFKTY